MWPFKTIKTISVKEAHNKALPVRYKGKFITSIEHHGKGYEPRPVKDQSNRPDVYYIYWGEKYGEMAALDAHNQLELIEKNKI